VKSEYPTGISQVEMHKLFNLLNKNILTMLSTVVCTTLRCYWCSFTVKR